MNNLEPLSEFFPKILTGFEIVMGHPPLALETIKLKGAPLSKLLPSGATENFCFRNPGGFTDVILGVTRQHYKDNRFQIVDGSQSESSGHLIAESPETRELVLLVETGECVFYVIRGKSPRSS